MSRVARPSFREEVREIFFDLCWWDECYLLPRIIIALVLTPFAVLAVLAKRAFTALCVRDPFDD